MTRNEKYQIIRRKLETVNDIINLIIAENGNDISYETKTQLDNASFHIEEILESQYVMKD